MLFAVKRSETVDWSTVSEFKTKGRPNALDWNR